jgi:hypothetical protein
MGRPFVDLSGKQFGAWTVKALYGTANKKGVHHSLWVCKCKCGEESIVTASNLKRGKNLGCKVCTVNSNRKKPFESLYLLLLSTATRRGVEVNLSYAEYYLYFTTQSWCHYCLGDVVWKPYQANANGHKLDRKDNAVGYTKDNCVVCCSRCNRAKSNHFTYEEFVALGKVIATFGK